MSDSKSLAGREDRDRISSNEGYEVEALHRQYPYLKHEQVKELIQKYGPTRTKIEAYLDSLKK